MRNKTLVVIIFILLLTNIGLLVFFLQKEEHPVLKRPGFTEKLKKEVGFTPQQMEIFEPKKKLFWQSMRKRFDTIKKAKEDFYFNIYNSNVSDSLLNSKADKIGSLQKEMDLFVFKHFSDVRKICTPEQLPKYDSLMPALIKRITDRPERK